MMCDGEPSGHVAFLKRTLASLAEVAKYVHSDC